MITLPRHRRASALLATGLLLASPVLTGCFSGKAATTTVQSTMNSGNGTDANVGDLAIENATIVLGPEGSGSATLIGSVFNNGAQDDMLVDVTINGTPAVVTPGAEKIPAGSNATYGYDSMKFINSYTFDAEPSAYVPVTLQFANAGVVEMSVLSVPATGIYEGIAPTPSLG